MQKEDVWSADDRAHRRVRELIAQTSLSPNLAHVLYEALVCHLAEATPEEIEACKDLAADANRRRRLREGEVA